MLQNPDQHYARNAFCDTTPPITKIINPIESGYSPQNKPHFASFIYNLYNTFRIFILPQKGDQGITKSKKGNRQAVSGRGFTTNDPTTRSGWRSGLANPPPRKKLLRIRLSIATHWCFSLTQDRQQATQIAQQWCNMVSTISLLYCRHESQRSWMDAVIIYVDNFVSNYSHHLLHQCPTYTIGINTIHCV